MTQKRITLIDLEIEIKNKCGLEYLKGIENDSVETRLTIYIFNYFLICLFVIFSRVFYGR